MSKSSKPAAKKQKKAYATPKLTTHGDVAKLTKHGGEGHDHEHGHGRSSGFGSGLFDVGGRGRD